VVAIASSSTRVFVGTPEPELDELGRPGPRDEVGRVGDEDRPLVRVG
jgi:hypothetical protein